MTSPELRRPSQPPPASPPARRRRRVLGIAIGLLTGLGGVLVACGGGGSEGATPEASADGSTNGTTPTTPTPATPTAPTPTPPVVPTDPVATPTTPAVAKVLQAGLTHPWALAFLPDGRMLVTQRGGEMVVLSADGATRSASLTGLPGVTYDSQGGLLDVALDPDFDLSTNPWIYWTYAESDGGGNSGTAVARGRLNLNSTAVVAGAVPGSLTDVAVIYRQLPRVQGGGQYGSRLAFRADKTLFVTLGDRVMDDPARPGTQYSQNTATTLGKVIRIQRDGSLPTDNPSFGVGGARPELWSIGHRNPQGAAIHPVTGDLWVTEHGPQGGDELNHVQAGKNYGWPLRSYGCPYSVTYGAGVTPESCRVGGGTHAPAYVEPVSFWLPKSIAPSGLIFYAGSKFPEWKHNVLMGAMNGYDTSGYPEIQRGLWRLVLNGDTVVQRERLGLIDDEVRDVRQGPDGWIYVLTKTSGKLIRIER